VRSTSPGFAVQVFMSILFAGARLRSGTGDIEMADTLSAGPEC